MALDLRILGPLEVYRDGEIVKVPGHKARVVLVCLITHRGHPVSRDRLIDALWRDTPPKSAVNTLHTYITHLRGALAGGSHPDPIKTHANGYQLEVEEDGVDAWRFEVGLADARRHVDRREYAAAITLAESMLSEWRGPPLEEFLDADFAVPEANRLTDLRVAVEHLRADALLRSGEAVRAAELLGPQVGEFPYREELWELLMLALYRSGRQTEALAAFRMLGEELADIGLTPSQALVDLESRILEQDPALLEPGTIETGPKSTPAPIPRPADALVGRVSELDQLQTLAEENRLITLTGIGGVGKSRLAVAAVLGWSTPGRYCDLAAVSDAETAAGRLGEALGAPEMSLAGLGRWVANELSEGPPTTLLVDNAEHLAAEIGPTLAEIVRQSDFVRVVVTSREPLGVDTEVTFAVQPLTVESPEFPSEAELLFLKRSSLSPADKADEAAISSICRAVNGIPAAVEIAAGASKVLSLPELASNLDMLVVGEGGRHSLSKVVDWSLQAMTDRQRSLFMAASVFVDGFTFDALLEVTETQDQRVAVLTDLRALIERSLVTMEARRATRYRILDVVRDIGLKHIDPNAMDRDVYERFIAYFLDLAQSLERAFGSDKWQTELERVDAEEANVAEALKRAIEMGDATSAFMIAGPMGRYWRWRGRSIEGQQRLLSVSRLPGADQALRAKVERELAGVHRILGDFEESMTHARTALDMYEAIGHEEGKADALYDLGLAEIFAGRFSKAVPPLEQSTSIWNELEQPSLAAFPMIPLAWLAMIHGEYERAEAMWTSILTNVDTALFPEHSGITFRVAELAFYQGQLDRARSVAEEAVESARRARYPYHEAGARSVLARIGLARSDAEEADTESDLALAAARESGNVEVLAQASMVKGHLALLDGDVPSALRMLHSWTQTAGHIGGAISVVALASFGARIQMERAQWSDAARLFGAEANIRGRHGFAIPAPDGQVNQVCIDRVRAELGDADFEKMYGEGTDLDEESVMRALRSWFV